MAENKWFEQKTVNGYFAHEVASAMQKEIRRCNPEAAMYWASELFLSNFDNYCWKRLEIIMVEDVDITQTGLFADIHALRMTAAAGRKERREGRPDERESLCLMAAVTRLACARKSRINCNATVFYTQMPRQDLRPIPDYALDRHTFAGKRKGRDWEHFFVEGAAIEQDGQLTNEEDDPYLEIVRDWLVNSKSATPRKSEYVDNDKSTLF